jgi:hypothetical protein
MSAESGLDTFRDKDGLWSRFDPMKLATPEAFARNPDAVHALYNLRRQSLPVGSAQCCPPGACLPSELDQTGLAEGPGAVTVFKAVLVQGLGGSRGLKRDEVARIDHQAAGLLAGMGSAWLRPCSVGIQGGDAAPSPFTKHHNPEDRTAASPEAEGDIRDYHREGSAGPVRGQANATTTVITGA